MRTASRGSFLKPFNKLAARVLSDPKPLVVLNLIKLCCSFIKLYSLRFKMAFNYHSTQFTSPDLKDPKS